MIRKPKPKAEFIYEARPFINYLLQHWQEDRVKRASVEVCLCFGLSQAELCPDALILDCQALEVQYLERIILPIMQHHGHRHKIKKGFVLVKKL